MLANTVVSVAKTLGGSKYPEDWIHQEVFAINEDGTYMVNMSIGIGTFADSDLEFRVGTGGGRGVDPYAQASNNCHTNFVWQKCAITDSDSTHFLPGFAKSGDLTDDLLKQLK